MHRYRGRGKILFTLLVTTLAGAGLVAAAAPAATATPRQGVEFPRPGGGPRVIDSYVGLLGDPVAYLLDTAAGEYRRLPYVNLAVSPDGRRVAVEDASGRFGVADRDALLRAGDAAVRWTGLPGGSPGWWSPDGTALLVTTLDKQTATFTAHRYDVVTARLSSLPIDLECDVCVAGWAADSSGYLVQLRGAQPGSAGPLGYLSAAGRPGPVLDVRGAAPAGAGAYSPSGRYLVVEPPRPTDQPSPPQVYDLVTGTVVATVGTDFPVLGWYDEERVVRIAPARGGRPTTLEVVDIATGAVHSSVRAYGLDSWAIFQLGSSAGLTGAAAELGF